MFFRRVPDDALAQNAYLIGCQRTGEAIVIDPERDVDRYLELAAGEGLRVTAVAETHIHADFLSGARELAERVGARLYLSDEGGNEWRSRWALEGGYDLTLLHDGDRFDVGNIRFDVVHTPGHTPEHVSLLVTDVGGGADRPMGILSGDFVFVGDLGRPDLLESAAGVEGMMRPSAEALFGSIPKFLALPEYMQVWPAHGAGSACGKALGAVPASTVGYEKQFSPALRAHMLGEDGFVRWILEDQPEPPLYFARMKAENRDGVALLGDLPDPPRLTVDEIRAAAGAVVLDTRTGRRRFMGAHLRGSLHAPLDKSFPTIAGSYVSPDVEVYLIASPADVDTAVRALVRVGIDRVHGFASPHALERADDLSSIKTVDFEQAAAIGDDGVILDVRGAAEYAAGHLPEALNIAHTRLPERLGEVPTERVAWVHCRSGARAAAAAAYLAAAGRDVVLIDDAIDAYDGPLETDAVAAEA